MSDYQTIDVQIVTYRLKGQQIPETFKLAQQYPCQQCGAPPGFACTGSSEFCWKSRLLSDANWKLIRRARKAAPHSQMFKDGIYTGLLHLGMGNDNPLARAIRFMPEANLLIIKNILDTELVPVSDLL